MKKIKVKKRNPFRKFIFIFLIIFILFSIFFVHMNQMLKPMLLNYAEIEI